MYFKIGFEKLCFIHGFYLCVMIDKQREWPSYVKLKLVLWLTLCNYKLYYYNNSK